ncbi:MAG: FtsX-like permease family protein [Phycisphaerales bacterium]|nr:FtsX-like permease family protein [Phycisphaerales bacterium]
MPIFALKMLFGDSARFYGMLLGLAFSTLLISQQASIFVGLMTRTFGFITDTQQPDLWIADPVQRFLDDNKPLRSTAVQRIRSIEGIDWAVPLYKGLLSVALPDGKRQMSQVIGIDDASLIGGPATMLEGSLTDLRKPDAIIVDVRATKREFRLTNPPEGGPPRDLRVGDSMELNDRRAEVVGICRATQTFQSQPVIYTTYNRAIGFAPRERRMVTMVLAGLTAGADEHQVVADIDERTGLAAYTGPEFEEKTVGYWMSETGIPINFGTAILLGFFVGIAVAGQMFYNFVLDNLKYFGAMKAMGASRRTLLGMVVLQASTVAFLGFGIGIGLTSAFGISLPEGRLAFRMVWQIPLMAACAVTVICALSAALGLWRVIRLDPADVFQGT